MSLFQEAFRHFVLLTTSGILTDSEVEKLRQQLRSEFMGHYDNCRPGYCPVCGAAPGNIVNGVCEFCELKRNTKLGQTFERLGGPDSPKPEPKRHNWKPPKPLPSTPAPAPKTIRQAAYEEYMERTRPDTRKLDGALDALRDEGTARRPKGHRIDVTFDKKDGSVTVQVNGRIVQQSHDCESVEAARKLGIQRQETLAAANIHASLSVHEV